MVNIIKELATFIPPAKDLDTLEPPLHVGDPAPDIYVEPKGQQKLGYIVAFLRHIGCPFCEKTFLELRNLALLMPRYHYIAVSHGSIEATQKWCLLIGGHANVQVITDDSRHLYATWGLPLIGFRHLVDSKVLTETKRLQEEEGIAPGRVTSSGSRWQGAGAFAVLFDQPTHDMVGVDANQVPGTIIYAHQAKHAADVPELKVAVKALEAERRKRVVNSANAKQAVLDGQLKQERRRKILDQSDAGMVPSPLHLISEPSSRSAIKPPRRTHFADEWSAAEPTSRDPSPDSTSDSSRSTSGSSSPPSSATPSPSMSAVSSLPSTAMLTAGSFPMLSSTFHTSSSIPTVASPAFSASSNISTASASMPRSSFVQSKSVFRPSNISSNSADSINSANSTNSTNSMSSTISNASVASSNSSVCDLYKSRMNRRKSSSSAYVGPSSEFVINRLRARAISPLGNS